MLTKSASIAVMAALALAAGGCKKSGPGAEPTTAVSDDAMAPTAAATMPAPAATLTPGAYEVSSGGKVTGTTTINADGTYRDAPRKGLAVAGIVKMTDGKTCFDPSGKKGPECWTESPRAADGSFTAVSDTGEKVSVKPTAQ